MLCPEFATHCTPFGAGLSFQRRQYRSLRADSSDSQFQLCLLHHFTIHTATGMTAYWSACTSRHTLSTVLGSALSGCKAHQPMLGCVEQFLLRHPKPASGLPSSSNTYCSVLKVCSDTYSVLLLGRLPVVSLTLCCSSTLLCHG